MASRTNTLIILIGVLALIVLSSLYSPLHAETKHKKRQFGDKLEHNGTLLWLDQYAMKRSLHPGELKKIQESKYRKVEKLSLEANFRGLLNAFRRHREIENQCLAMGHRCFANVVDGFLLVDPAHRDILQLAGQVEDLDVDVCGNR